MFPRNQYVNAVLLESMRLNHIVPIVGPRRVLQKTSLNGYSIPKVYYFCRKESYTKKKKI